MKYKYDNVFDFVVSLDDIIIPARDRYSSKDEITNLIKKILILGEQEIDPSKINMGTYRSAVLSLIMQRYFLNNSCSKKVLWFPELIKFKDITVPIKIDE